MTMMNLVRRRLGERCRFNLSEFIGRRLILPKGDTVISDLFAYEEGGIRFSGQKTRLDSEKLVAALVAESADSLPWMWDPDESYEEGDG